MPAERFLKAARVREIVAVVTSALVVAAMLLGCERAGPPPRALRPVSIQMAWLHEAPQGAGFYAAVENGYYAAEGLAMTLLPGGPSVDRVAAVLGGTAQLGVAGADELLLARAEGKPVRAVVAIFRRSPIVFVAEADSGIKRPQDFAGKTIRVTPILVPSLRAMMARVGVSPDQYREVVLPSDIAEFRSGKAPVWAAYITSLVVSLERAGHRLNRIYPEDYGVHQYGDTLFTTDELIAGDPDLVARVVRATLEGWRFAVENPHKVAALVRRYRPDADADLETAKMVATIPLVNTGEDSIGWMKPEAWAGMEQLLRREGVLKPPLDASQAYTLQFLEGIYGRGGAEGAGR